MAYDSGMLRAVVFELNRLASGAKVERVTQPGRDEIDLLLASGGVRRRFCINAGASLPHMAFSAISKENPATPPMFCMLLRKHLAGAHLTGSEQIGFERVARLRFSCYDDMGYPTEKSLYAEIMGKYSNLILTDADDKILAVLRPVDFTTSRLRQVLPGMRYELPPAQDKTDPLAETAHGFLARLNAAPVGKAAVRYLTDTYVGIATQTASEIVFRAAARVDLTLGEIEAASLANVFCDWFLRVREGLFSPTLVRGADGAPLDYSYEMSGYRGSGAAAVAMSDFGSLLDAFFAERGRSERIAQRASDILRLLTNAEARLARKLDAQREELAACDRADEYRREADLIVANIYRLQRGMTEFVATDYSEGEPRDVLVRLDGRLAPSANAQKLYKLYNKSKTARRILQEQIERSAAELAYLGGVRGFLDRAETEADLTEIRDELYRAGYASRMKGYTAARGGVKLRPREFVTAGGYRLLCGRNNLQNEQLTFQTAAKGDLWFHAKGVPGSHVLLLCDGEEPDAADYTAAAEIAAYYSSAEAAPVAVDYTRVKNVKKPAGAKPGYVIYKTNYTAYVTPRLSLEEKKK